MNGKLVLVGGGSEGQPRGRADWERLVEWRCQGGEEGSVV